MGQGLEERPGEELCGQRFLYEEKGGGAVIWRCFSYEERAEVPPRVGGLAVTGLAPYCFSAHMDPEILRAGVASGWLKLWPEGEEPAPELCGGRLRELALPQSVSHVGRYCLYNCGSLELLEFDGALSDWGSGVFTGCHRLARIRLCPDGEGRSSLKQVLDEVPEALEVELLARPGEGLPEAVLVSRSFMRRESRTRPPGSWRRTCTGAASSTATAFWGAPSISGSTTACSRMRRRRSPLSWSGGW